MEIIKKKILQALTTGKTDSSTDNTFIIIPDLSKIYNINVLLTQDVENLGFFDVAPDIIFSDSDDYYYDYEYGYGYGYNNATSMEFIEPIGLNNLI